MSYVIAAPDMLAAAAADVAGIGSSLSEANTAAAASTTRVIAAAADEVSAAIASLFSSHGTAFQALSAQAADFHARFVTALDAGARAYASTEAVNAAISVGGHTLEFGTATATSGTGDFAIALGAHSTATAAGSGGIFDTAIAVGTNDAAYTGDTNYGPPNPDVLGGIPGRFDTAIVVGTGSTAWAGASLPDEPSGNFDLAAVINGNMQNATATGGNFLVDIVTPFGTL